MNADECIYSWSNFHPHSLFQNTVEPGERGSFKYLEYTIFVIHLYFLQILGKKVRNKVLYIK